ATGEVVGEQYRGRAIGADAQAQAVTQAVVVAGAHAGIQCQPLAVIVIGDQPAALMAVAAVQDDAGGARLPASTRRVLFDRQTRVTASSSRSSSRSVIRWAACSGPLARLA